VPHQFSREHRLGSRSRPDTTFKVACLHCRRPFSLHSPFNYPRAQPREIHGGTMTKRRSSLPCSKSIHRAFRPSSARGPGLWRVCSDSIRAWGSALRTLTELDEKEGFARAASVPAPASVVAAAACWSSLCNTHMLNLLRHGFEVSQERPDVHFHSGVSPVAPPPLQEARLARPTQDNTYTPR
jgi:hypothetical protein